jgi:hypothetical protein
MFCHSIVTNCSAVIYFVTSCFFMEYFVTGCFVMEYFALCLSQNFLQSYFGKENFFSRMLFRWTFRQKMLTVVDQFDVLRGHRKCIPRMLRHGKFCLGYSVMNRNAYHRRFAIGHFAVRCLFIKNIPKGCFITILSPKMCCHETLHNAGFWFRRGKFGSREHITLWLFAGYFIQKRTIPGCFDCNKFSKFKTITSYMCTYCTYSYVLGGS